MELLLKNGDYVPDGKGGFLRVSGRDALLQRVLWKLTARRGAFPFLPELGSELYTLSRAKPSMWNTLAKQYAAQALADEQELTVQNVAVTQREGKLELRFELDWNGETMDVKVEVEE